MSKGKELVKNTAILMAAKLATHFVSFFLMPLYTAILSTEEYGESDIYSTLATILLPFFTLQIEMSLFRFFISDKDDNEKRKTVTSAFFISAICLGTSAVIYLAVSSFIEVKYRFYLLSCGGNEAARAPKAWKVFGVPANATDSSSWTELDAQSGYTSWTMPTVETTNEFTIAEEKIAGAGFRAFRFVPLDSQARTWPNTNPDF